MEDGSPIYCGSDGLPLHSKVGADTKLKKF
jgi:hypothetical protein